MTPSLVEQQYNKSCEEAFWFYEKYSISKTVFDMGLQKKIDEEDSLRVHGDPILKVLCQQSKSIDDLRIGSFVDVVL